MWNGVDFSKSIHELIYSNLSLGHKSYIRTFLTNATLRQYCVHFGFQCRVITPYSTIINY